jgi:hypothetical protein
MQTFQHAEVGFANCLAIQQNRIVLLSRIRLEAIPMTTAVKSQGENFAVEP